MDETTTKSPACPHVIEVEAGKTYQWCQCCRSGAMPLCDGSHQGTGCEPLTFVAQKTEAVILCGCGETDDPPYCDGTHNVL